VIPQLARGADANLRATRYTAGFVMEPSKISHETRLRVRYAETDQMGVVYYSNYLVWMEVGRVELCKAMGFNYRDMEREDGVCLAVAEARCRYVAPARFDDEVTVKTWIEQAGTRVVTFGYEMRRGGQVLAKGETKHVLCDTSLRPARLPKKYYRLFGISES
jgi:acyl-CoA thioester hydrolase